MERRQVSSRKGTTVSRFFQGIENNCPEQLYGSTNKGVLEHEKLLNRGDITASETRIENRQVKNANTSRDLKPCPRPNQEAKG